MANSHRQNFFPHGKATRAPYSPFGTDVSMKSFMPAADKRFAISRGVVFVPEKTFSLQAFSTTALNRCPRPCWPVPATITLSAVIMTFFVGCSMVLMEGAVEVAEQSDP